MSDAVTHKARLTVPLEVKSIGENGTFEGYGSVFGNVDADNDVILPGAFAESLDTLRQKDRTPAMLYQHFPSFVIGKWTEVKEDDRGLYVKGLLANTERAKEVHELMKIKAIDGLSIGFSYGEKDYEVNNHSGLRLFKRVNLWEVSIVTFPANDAARVSGVKSMLDAGEIPTIRDFERFLRDAGLSRTQAKALLSDGYKAIDCRDDDHGVLSAAGDLLKTIQNAGECIHVG